ncbi:hypothetical protein [Erythrobacter aureus]|uniref:hypothetical protein n=1 Tax=Erythrobacter aureus TaxID=2182384 RepID=UPI0013B36170|nr:hypothetical protein [Erythrobacter aureus]
MEKTAKRWPLLLAIVVALSAIWAGFAAGENLAEDWQLAARWTARVGLPIFLLVYSASTLVRLLPSKSTKALLRDRRWWGLGFAASHTIHLYALTMVFVVGPDSRSPVSLIPGGLAYAMIYVMAVTSNAYSMRKLGRSWKRLHTLGMHYIWLVYTASYAGRIFQPEKQVEGLVGTSLLVAAFILRIAVRWPRHRTVRV